MAFADMKKANDLIMERDSRVSDLELQVATVESARDAKELELKKQWEKEKEKEKARADKAEKEAGDLKAEVARLKGLLADQEKVGAEAIAKYKQSEAYDQEIADAGAPEIQRCWLVAERHIKTDPAADWKSFIEEFLQAKENIEKGLGEPVPYNGPNPAFFPAIEDQAP